MSDPAPLLIAAENLGKVYKLDEQEVEALCGVTLNVERSEFVAIMGPSGSGKSTLMNLIGCLDTPTSGTLRLNGKLVSAMSEDELAFTRNREIGFVFQVFNLLSRASAFHNVELPLVYAGTKKAERQEKARRALERVEMKARMNHKPSELSGGERQRVAIARALLSRPAVLLADEPTGNLDAVSGEAVIQLFSGMVRDGVTVLVVTHEERVSTAATRVLHLEDGRLR